MIGTWHPARLRAGGKGARVSRRSLGVLLLTVALTAGAGLAQAETGPAKAAEIHIDNFAFTPAVLEIAAGTTVTWTNRDDIPHTVVEKAIAFKSKPMDTDEQFTHTFDKPGEIEYFCSLHPHMTGKIVVKP